MGGRVSDGIRIVGKTPIGRATVVALHLSDDVGTLTACGWWVLAGGHPLTVIGFARRQPQGVRPSGSALGVLDSVCTAREGPARRSRDPSGRRGHRLQAPPSPGGACVA
jgi:hypothetical protein